MNEINKIPLVDILSKKLNKQIVMKDNNYVELGTLELVSQEDINTALEEQGNLYVEELQQTFNKAIQNHLDTKAQSLKYDDINAIGKYVGYDNDFRVEAEALGAWASACWKVAGEIEADVKAGNRDMPTVEGVLEELPKYDDDGGE